ncbi:MAG: hypothetical protein ACRDUB_13825, partial [Mycobacterium sp.]
MIAGSGLGLFNSTLSQFNGLGAWGRAGIGSGTDRVYVNASTGNLVIQSQDDYLAALGLDSSLVRTYNSLGLQDDDNGDNWRMSVAGKLLNVPVGTAKTDIIRVNGDGERATFVYDTGTSRWVSFDGAGAHDTIRTAVVNGATVWIYEEGSSGVSETYDTSGKLLSVADRDGNTVSYTSTFTGSGAVRVTAMTYTSGQTVYLEYDANNRLTQIRMADGGGNAVRVRYDYDGSGRLSTVKVDLANPDDNTADAAASTYTTTYTYDGATTRVASITQSDGSSLQIAYQLVGSDYRVSSLTTLLAGTTTRQLSFTYDTTNRRTDVTEPGGLITSFYYDTANRLTKVETPTVGGARSSTSYAYDTADNITQVTTTVASGVTRTVSYTYDSSGNLTESRDSLGNTVRRTYNGANQVLTETSYLVPDPDGAGTGQPGTPLTTRYVYDAEQHLRYIISDEGRVTRNDYDTTGQLIRTRRYPSAVYTATNVLEATLDAWTDGLTNKTGIERTEYTYDTRGQMRSAMRYSLTKIDGELDAGGVISTTWYLYGRAGELLQSVDARHASGATATASQPYVTSYVYDGLGRLTAATDASGRVTSTAICRSTRAPQM